MALNAVRMKKKVVLVSRRSRARPHPDGRQGAGRRPLLGMRAKLYARGSGSGPSPEARREVRPDDARCSRRSRSRSPGVLDAMIMLHFHIGSQITDIRKIGLAIREAGRVYAKLRALGVPIQYLNSAAASGGLRRLKTAFDSSMNYSVRSTPTTSSTPSRPSATRRRADPDLVTESGRGDRLPLRPRHQRARRRRPIEQERRVRVTANDPAVIQELASILASTNAKTSARATTTLAAQGGALHALQSGHPSLEDRSRRFSSGTSASASTGLEDLDEIRGIRGHGEDARGHLRDELLRLPVAAGLVGDDQLFPILLIHRLNERPGSRHARRHHLRLRQDRQVHRPARHQGDAAAPHVPPRGLLRRLLPDGRTGRAGRSSQPLRRGARSWSTWTRTASPTSRSCCRARAASACSST